MRGFLLDENLPGRFTFKPSWPVQQVGIIGNNPTDEQIWEYAKANDWVIVTKDADFSHRILINPPPPRVVHLRVGNLKLSRFHQLLQQVWPEVERLLLEHKLVNLYEDRLEAIAHPPSE